MRVDRCVCMSGVCACVCTLLTLGTGRVDKAGNLLETQTTHVNNPLINQCIMCSFIQNIYHYRSHSMLHLYASVLKDDPEHILNIVSSVIVKTTDSKTKTRPRPD